MSKALITRGLYKIQRERSAQLTVRLPVHVIEALRKHADADGVSVNQVVAALLTVVVEDASG